MQEQSEPGAVQTTAAAEQQEGQQTDAAPKGVANTATMLGASLFTCLVCTPYCDWYMQEPQDQGTGSATAAAEEEEGQQQKDAGPKGGQHCNDAWR